MSTQPDQPFHPQQPSGSSSEDLQTTGEIPVVNRHYGQSPSQPEDHLIYPSAGMDQNGQETPSSSDTTLGALAHFGCFIAAVVGLGIIAPILTYLLGGNREFVRHHSKQSINLNLTTYLLLTVAAILAMIASITGGISLWILVNPSSTTSHSTTTTITIVLLFLLLAGFLLWLLYYFIATLRAGFAAIEGRPYYFRLCLPFMGRGDPRLTATPPAP